MKILAFGTFVCCALHANGQIKKTTLNDSSIYPIKPLLLQKNIIGKSPYGTIYTLPQDKMPVVAADSNSVKQIPNGFRGPIAQTIPNSMIPKRKFKQLIIPDSLKGKPIVIPVPKEKPEKK